MKTTAPALSLAVLCVAVPAYAHPDVWITNQLTAVFDGGGRLAEVREKWSFDYAYSLLARQLLDKNANGVFDRDELVEAVNVGGFLGWIAQTDYMTRLTLAGRTIQHGPVAALSISVADGKLIIDFAVPLSGPQPIPNGAGIDVFDEAYYYGFQYAPVQAVEAPVGCRVDQRWEPNLTAEKTPSTEIAEKFLDGNIYAVRIQVDCAP